MPGENHLMLALKYLTGEEFNKFIDNLQDKDFKFLFANNKGLHFLKSSFAWDFTPEGYSYWKEVEKRVLEDRVTYLYARSNTFLYLAYNNLPIDVFKKWFKNIEPGKLLDLPSSRVNLIIESFNWGGTPESSDYWIKISDSLAEVQEVKKVELPYYKTL